MLVQQQLYAGTARTTAQSVPDDSELWPDGKTWRGKRE